VAADPKAFGNCRFCAVAVPADVKICPICGADHPIRSGEMGQETRRTRQRVQGSTSAAPSSSPSGSSR